MSTLVRTDDVPAAERFSFWRTAGLDAEVPMEVFTDEEESFWARMHSGLLGAVRMSVVTSAPYGVRRPDRLIDRSDPDLLRLLMPLPGNVHCHPIVIQDGREAQLSPAQFALYDTRRPYEVRPVRGTSGPIRALTMLFPRSMLPLPPADLRRVTAVPLAADRGVGTLAAQLLMRLAD